MPVQQKQEQRGTSWLRLEMAPVQHTFDRTIWRYEQNEAEQSTAVVNV